MDCLTLAVHKILTFGFLTVSSQSHDEGNLMGYGSPHYGSAIYEENNNRALSTERGDHDDSLGESPDRALLDFPFSGMRLSHDDCQDGMTKELCHQVASGKVEVSTGGCSGKSQIVCNPTSRVQKPPKMYCR